jgi:hypothetical protein
MVRSSPLSIATFNAGVKIVKKAVWLPVCSVHSTDPPLEKDSKTKILLASTAFVG